MVDVSIVNKTSPEANWNRQTGGQTGRRAGRQAGKPMCREAVPPKIVVGRWGGVGCVGSS